MALHCGVQTPHTSYSSHVSKHQSAASVLLYYISTTHFYLLPLILFPAPSPTSTCLESKPSTMPYDLKGRNVLITGGSAYVRPTSFSRTLFAIRVLRVSCCA